jgi:hypothetical protein
VFAGVTPSAPDDVGQADPRLAAALASGDAAAIRRLALTTRLLVPVVAMPAEGADAEMAVPALVHADGARALPVFSSYDALRAWRMDARPVPMLGARVFAGAAAEGHDAVVIDVAGPAMHAIQDVDLQALAAAGRQMLDPSAAQSC